MVGGRKAARLTNRAEMRMDTAILTRIRRRDVHPAWVASPADARMPRRNTRMVRRSPPAVLHAPPEHHDGTLFTP